MTIIGGVKDPVLLEFVVEADTDLVAAVTDKKIRVLAMALGGEGGNAIFESGTTELFGPFLLSQGSVVLPFLATGWFETDAGEALRIDLSGTNKTGGSITYALI